MPDEIEEFFNAARADLSTHPLAPPDRLRLVGRRRTKVRRAYGTVAIVAAIMTLSLGVTRLQHGTSSQPVPPSGSTPSTAEHPSSMWPDAERLPFATLLKWHGSDGPPVPAGIQAEVRFTDSCQPVRQDGVQAVVHDTGWAAGDASDGGAVGSRAEYANPADAHAAFARMSTVASSPTCAPLQLAKITPQAGVVTAQLLSYSATAVKAPDTKYFHNYAAMSGNTIVVLSIWSTNPAVAVTGGDAETLDMLATFAATPTATTPSTTAPATTPSTTAPATAPAGSTASAPPTATVPQTCDMTQLAVAFGRGGVATGHIGVPLVFRNVGSKVCRLHGYPDVTGIDGGGHQVTNAQQTSRGFMGGLPPGSDSPPVVDLAPGQVASAFLEYVSVDVPNGVSCKAVGSIRITAPGEAHGTSLPFSSAGCSNMEVHPIFPGDTGRPAANPGTT